MKCMKILIKCTWNNISTSTRILYCLWEPLVISHLGLISSHFTICNNLIGPWNVIGLVDELQLLPK